MIDIRKQPALIECINMVLTSGHKAEVKQEKDHIIVIGVEEQRKIVGKVDVRSTKV